MVSAPNIDIAKNDELQSHLASIILQTNEGVRLPSVRDIAATTGVSIGSASKALAALVSMGAVKICKRGHLGSFVGERSISELWNIAWREPIVIAMTIPLNLRFAGLCTAVKSNFTLAGMKSYVICMRGAPQRLQALREKRCHAAIMSGIAAKEFCSENEEIALTLPAGSWTNEQSIFFRPGLPESQNYLRVAYDRTSTDHEYLTKLIFNHSGVEFKKVSGFILHKLLSEGEVDAAVWDAEAMKDHPGHGCSIHPIPDRVRKIIGNSETTATIVIRRGEASVHAVIQSILSVNSMMEIQRKVMDLEIDPEF
jgi:hypothetical protein